MEPHNRQTLEEYQLSPSAREILAVIEAAGQALERPVIAERLLITTGSTISLLDALEKRGLIRRLAHPRRPAQARHRHHPGRPGMVGPACYR